MLRLFARCLATVAFACLCAACANVSPGAEKKARVGPFRLGWRRLGSALAFSPDGQQLVAARIVRLGDISISRWSLASGKHSDMFLKNPEPYEPGVGGASHFVWPALQLLGDGELVAFRGWRETIFICDTRSGEVLHRIPTQTAPFILSPDGKLIAQPNRLAEATEMVLLDVATRKSLGAVPARPTGVLWFSADHQLFVAPDRPNGFVLWKARQSPKEIARFTLKGPFGAGPCAVSPDGKKVAAWCELHRSDWEVVWWEASTGRLIRRSDISFVSDELPRAILFSPNGDRLAAATTGRLIVWATGTGAQLMAVQRPDDHWPMPGIDARHRAHLGIDFEREHDRSQSIGFAPDSRTLAAASNDGFIRLWDTDTGVELTAK